MRDPELLDHPDSAKVPEGTNRTIDAQIRAQAESMAFGRLLAAEGITTVALDSNGTIVEHRPDGSWTILS